MLLRYLVCSSPSVCIFSVVVNLSVSCSGLTGTGLEHVFSITVRENWKRWVGLVDQIEITPLEELPAQKVFTPKHGLPVLPSYKVDAPTWYWNGFPSNFLMPGISRVKPDVLESLALQFGFQDRELLDAICTDLKFGADIGCEGPFRAPTKSTNAPSSFEFGPHVSDAIADWIKKGFAYGPVLPEEVPPDAKINGIMCRPKPNGSVRIILNLSAPVGNSVNEGIDESKFPATMSSTTKWLRVLNRAGRECRMVKIDWADAYKHVAVRRQDMSLQWFMWLGMAFCELCLIFGSKSSVGIYDRLAKVVLFIACGVARMDRTMTCQHLDDCAAAAPKGAVVLEEFDQAFKSISEKLGITLAPRDDPEKSFGPSTRGVVFGVYYDTVAWTWAIPKEKYIRILHQLQEGIEADCVSQEYMMSVAGRIINIKPLVPSGKYNVDLILKAAAASQIKTDRVLVSSGLRSQLRFWFTMIQVCSGRVKIPDPDMRPPAWALDMYTDASGGGFGHDGRRTGRGVGALTKGWWAYVPWSSTICRGPLGEDGRRLNRKMSALELVGPLLVISAGFSLCKGKPVRVWVDNAGSVGIWKKGYSTTCGLSTTIVKAIAAVAAGLGCWFDIVKITRCSNPGADMADAISKADFNRFWAINAIAEFGCPCEQAWVPVSLLSWLENPCTDDKLGDRILGEIGQRTSLLSL